MWASTPATQQGLLQLRTRARRADWAGNDWLLRGVQRACHQRHRRRQWIWSAPATGPATCSPDDILQLDVADPHMSSMRWPM